MRTELSLLTEDVYRVIECLRASKGATSDEEDNWIDHITGLMEAQVDGITLIVAPEPDDPPASAGEQAPST